MATWGNPYTHEEYSRTTWTDESWYKNRPANAPRAFECRWCGQSKQRLYSYDGNDRHLFCDRQCKESYK